MKTGSSIHVEGTDNTHNISLTIQLIMTHEKEAINGDAGKNPDSYMVLVLFHMTAGLQANFVLLDSAASEALKFWKKAFNKLDAAEIAC